MLGFKFIFTILVIRDSFQSKTLINITGWNTTLKTITKSFSLKETFFYDFFLKLPINSMYVEVFL